MWICGKLAQTLMRPGMAPVEEMWTNFWVIHTVSTMPYLSTVVHKRNTPYPQSYPHIIHKDGTRPLNSYPRTSMVIQVFMFET